MADIFGGSGAPRWMGPEERIHVMSAANEPMVRGFLGAFSKEQEAGIVQRQKNEERAWLKKEQNAAMDRLQPIIGELQGAKSFVEVQDVIRRNPAAAMDPQAGVLLRNWATVYDAMEKIEMSAQNNSALRKRQETMSEWMSRFNSIADPTLGQSVMSAGGATAIDPTTGTVTPNWRAVGEYNKWTLAHPESGLTPFGMGSDVPKWMATQLKIKSDTENKAADRASREGIAAGAAATRVEVAKIASDTRKDVVKTQEEGKATRLEQNFKHKLQLQDEKFGYMSEMERLKTENAKERDAARVDLQGKLQKELLAIRNGQRDKEHSWWMAAPEVSKLPDGTYILRRGPQIVQVRPQQGAPDWFKSEVQNANDAIRKTQAQLLKEPGNPTLQHDLIQAQFNLNTLFDLKDAKEAQSETSKPKDDYAPPQAVNPEASEGLPEGSYRKGRFVITPE